MLSTVAILRWIGSLVFTNIKTLKWQIIITSKQRFFQYKVHRMASSVIHACFFLSKHRVSLHKITRSSELETVYATYRYGTLSLNTQWRMPAWHRCRILNWPCGESYETVGTVLPVDHMIGDPASLTQRGSQRQAGENIPGDIRINFWYIEKIGLTMVPFETSKKNHQKAKHKNYTVPLTITHTYYCTERKRWWPRRSGRHWMATHWQIWRDLWKQRFQYSDMKCC